MGVRVEFWETPDDDLEQSIIRNYEAFKDWYIYVGIEMEHKAGLDLLNFFEQLTMPERLFEAIDPALLDEFVAIYLGDYCDEEPGRKIAVKNSGMMSIHNFEADYAQVKRYCSPAITTLYHYIMTGRSLLTVREFYIADPVYRYVRYTEEECRQLFDALSQLADWRLPEHLARMPGICAVLRAIENKTGKGMIVTVA